MIPAQQLLDQHLDNVAIRLRNPKPFTPNDFPAVQRIEQVIANKPLEEQWFFDSTGMPVGKSQGDNGRVGGGFIDEELNLLPSNQKKFYKDFWGSAAVSTHNHPTSNPANGYTHLPVGQRYAPLSDSDLIQSAYMGVPIRAVNSEFAGGMVHEFKPGVSYHRDISEILEPNPKLYLDPPAIEAALQSKKYSMWNDNDELVSVPLTEYNKPTLRTYSLPDASQINIPTMATDSFNIRRQPQPRQAVFQQLGDGTHQSYIDGRPYKILTEAETDAAIDRMRNDPKWQMTWKAYRGDSAF